MTQNGYEKIVGKLNELGDIEAELDKLIADLEDAKQGVLTVDQIEEIEGLEAEAAPKLNTAQKKIAKLITEIKALGKKQGETVKGETRQAVFTPAGWTWINDKLEGYALEHPAVLRCRKPKDPSVSIRVVK